MLRKIIRVFLTTFVGKIFGFLKIVLLVKFYGTNAVTDALIITISIYWFWSNIIVSSLFSITLIPSLAKASDDSGRMDITLKTLNSVNTVSIIMFLIVIFFNRQIVMLFAPVANPEFIRNAGNLMLYMSPLLFLIPSTEIFTLLNQYNDRLVISALNLTVWNVLHVVAFLFSYMVFPGSVQILILFFALSNILGYLLTSFIQIRATGYFKIHRFTSIFKISLDNTLMLLKNNYQYFISTMLTQLNIYVDNFFVARLDAGSISKYNIITKVPDLAQSLLVSAIAVVFFNNIVKNASKTGYYFVLFRKRIVLLAVAGVAFIYFFGADILFMIYGNRALHGLSGSLLTSMLVVMTCNVFIMVINALLVKVMIAASLSRVLLTCSCINVVINAAADKVFIVEYGLLGIAGSTLMASFILYLSLYLFYKRNQQHYEA